MYHVWLSILSPLAFVPAGQSPHKHPLSSPLWILPDPPLLLRHMVMWPLFRSRLDLTPFCQDHISSLSGELLGENLEPDAPFTGSDSSVPWGSPASGCFLFSLLLCRWHWHSANAKSSGCISSSGEGMKAQDGGSKAWKKSKMFLQLNVCYLNSLKKKKKKETKTLIIIIFYILQLENWIGSMEKYHWLMTATKTETLLCRQRSIWSKLWFFQ